MSNFKARETIPYTSKFLYTAADRKKVKALEGGGERMGTPNIFKKKKQRIRKINKDLKTNINKIKNSPNFTGKNQSQRIQELKDTAKQDRKDVNKKYEESKNLLKDYGMMAPTARGFNTMRKAGGRIINKKKGKKFSFTREEKALLKKVREGIIDDSRETLKKLKKKSPPKIKKFGTLTGKQQYLSPKEARKFQGRVEKEKANRRMQTNQELVDQYGVDAARGRRFGTPKRQKVDLAYTKVNPLYGKMKTKMSSPSDDPVNFKTTRKKYGGKITYKMTGGQVVDSSYD